MDADLPVVDPPSDLGDGQSAPVAGVLLAAGTGARFGSEQKLLATLEGQPIVHHGVRPLLEADADVDPVVAVLGHRSDEVADALAELEVRIVENPDYDSGRGRSVATGIDAVVDATAAVVALGDMPRVRPSTVDALVGAYRAGAGTALAPSYDGQRGNPVLFDRTCFDDLTAIEGDHGGRDVLLNHEDAALVPVDDPGVLVDVDVPEDLAALE